MEIYHILIITGVLFFIIEIFTVTFFAGSVGIGLFLASLGNYLGFSSENQIYIFSFGVISSFFAIRPFLSRFAYNEDKKTTNQNALIGRIATVNETIDSTINSGSVKLDGDIWKAKSINNELIEINKEVEVVNIESIILIVKLKNK